MSSTVDSTTSGNPIKGSSRYVPKFGLTLEFAGDHNYYVVDFRDNVSGKWDNDTIELTVNLGLTEAEELYWRLQEIVPKLREDRR